MGKYSGYHTLYGLSRDRTGVGVMVIVKTPNSFDLNTIDRSAAIKLVQELMEKLEATSSTHNHPTLKSLLSTPISEDEALAEQHGDAPSVGWAKSCCSDPTSRGGRCYNCGEWREELCVVTK